MPVPRCWECSCRGLKGPCLGVEQVKDGVRLAFWKCPHLSEEGLEGAELKAETGGDQDKGWSRGPGRAQAEEAGTQKESRHHTTPQKTGTLRAKFLTCMVTQVLEPRCVCYFDRCYRVFPHSPEIRHPESRPWPSAVCIPDSASAVNCSPPPLWVRVLAVDVMHAQRASLERDGDGDLAAHIARSSSRRL